MKFYIAACFELKELINGLYKTLKEKGHTVTVEWTKHLPIAPYEKNKELARKYAAEDILGVKDCDVFVLLSDPNVGRGKFVELGAAILSNLLFGRPKIFVIGENRTASLFYYHPVVNQRETFHEVLEEIGQEI